MHNAANAYAKNAQSTGNPRELEAQLLMRAASKLQAVHDRSTTDENDVISALRYNRRLWIVFSGALGRPENAMPQEIKQNLANLANFVLKHTLTLETAQEKQPDRVGILININREIAAGLRTQAQAA